MEKTTAISDVKLSERLASLGIMGTQLRTPPEIPIHHSTIILGALNWSPFIPRDVKKNVLANVRFYNLMREEQLEGNNKCTSKRHKKCELV